MIIKICGIKTLDIAQASVEAGADMLGFNFYLPSSRYITPEKIMATCKLDLAQLAGDETPQDLAAMDGKAFKAVRPRSLPEAEEKSRVFGRPTVPALLVDAHIKGAYGGTGETGDWALARQLAAQASILLAGGLNPENVAAAVRAVDPWGVDVASGVESSPGVKDPVKILAFIAAARSA